jgi:hypothetical protein
MTFVVLNMNMSSFFSFVARLMQTQRQVLGPAFSRRLARSFPLRNPQEYRTDHTRDGAGAGIAGIRDGNKAEDRAVFAAIGCRA